MNTKGETVFLAFYESRNFSFFATGPTSYTAYCALLEGLKVHGEQCGDTSHWWYEDDIYVMESSIGECLRDRAPLRSGGN